MTETKEQIAGAIDILEYLTGDDPVHERNAAKRVLSQVTQAWPGETRRLWWKWFSEACSSLGIRTKTLDCSLEEALALADDHALLVCYREKANGGQEWLGVLQPEKRRFQVMTSDGDPQHNSFSRRRLRNTLVRFSKDEIIRCVVLQPNEASLTTMTGEAKYSPIQRLFKLLQPEASDIWIVMVFALLVSVLALATPIAVEALVNTVAFGRFVQPIFVLALILLTFLGFQAALRGLQTYVVEIIQRRLFARIAGDLAFRLPRTEIEASDSEHSPELVNRFFDIVTVQKVAAQLMLDGLGLMLGTAIGMAVLGFYHPWLLGFDVLLLSAIAIIIFVMGRGAVSSAVKESKHKYYMASWLEDIASCPTAFRNDGGSEFALERADRLIHEYLGARRKHFRIVLRQVLFALGFQAVASTVLLGLGGWLVVSGELTLGQLVAAELIVTVIVGSFAKFGKHMESFYDLLASVDKLGVLFDIPIERQDGILAADSPGPASVQLNSVIYSWPGNKQGSLKMSVEIEPGDRVAFLGESGSGKSTLLDLIFGTRRPHDGHLTIDGFNPRDLRPDVLRKWVGLARGTETFHATIEENVHLHREGITAKDVRFLLDSVGLLEPVLHLEAGCDTIMTSSGAPLSENQCRLLGIARAASGNPSLLLIDGLLDALSEQELETCLAFLMDEKQPWTLVVTTSRQDIAKRLHRTIAMREHASL